MKNLFLLGLITLFIVSCQQEAPKDYVTLSGVIKNQNSDSLALFQKDLVKTIKVNSDGTFADTLKVAAGNFTLYDGTKQKMVYLKNGYDLRITLDAKEVDETITYEGTGAEPNNYLAKKSLLENEILDFESLMNMNKASFDKSMVTNQDKLTALLNETKNLDTTFIRLQKEDITMMSDQFAMMHGEKQAVEKLNGTESPKFTDYENYKGGSVSLDDLKGKYVYIDLWATWCGPCKEEIPFLKEVEEKYHGKNIEFVSISIDNKNKYDAWRAMVEEKELTGLQLYANEDESFMDSYKVSGIPRFILISPEGEIVSADAPRPSSELLIPLFDSLNI